LNHFYETARQYSKMETYGSVYKGFNDTLASWSPPGGKHIDQLCGQTWLRTFEKIQEWYSPSRPLAAMQLVTWNDYEEGTALETGIDNCVKLSAKMKGGVLEWTLSGQENTIDHYVLFLSEDGKNLMPLGEFPAGSRSVRLDSFPLPSGRYSLFLKAVGKPSIRNHVAGPLTYTADGQSGNSPMGARATSPRRRRWSAWTCRRGWNARSAPRP
jgi:hypothetical protein